MKSRAVVTVLGKDQVGIVAKVASVLADNGVNIEDISQTIMEDVFSMVMLITIDEEKVAFASLGEQLSRLADGLGLQINLQHHDVFDYMHRV